MTTEYLYDDNAPIDPKNYRAKIGCINCDTIKLIDIIKGKPVDIWCTEGKIKCSKCECLETIVSYQAYKAQKAMMNQIMQMAKAEDDTENKKMNYYG